MDAVEIVDTLSEGPKNADYWTAVAAVHSMHKRLNEPSGNSGELAALTPPASKAVGRVIFTNRKKPDVEWLVDRLERDTLLYTTPQHTDVVAELPAMTGEHMATLRVAFDGMLGWKLSHMGRDLPPGEYRLGLIPAAIQNRAAAKDGE